MFDLSRRGRLLLCRWLAFVGLLTLTAMSGRAAADPQPFEIAAGSAADTLREFGKQAGLQTLFDYRLVRDLRTQAVKGSFEPDDALRHMLAGTSLTFDRIDQRTVAIHSIGAPGPVPSGAPSSAHASENPLTSASMLTTTGEENGEGRSAHDLTEVIVTANRRLQRSQDVAATLQVFSGGDLERRGADGFEDYLLTVPGVSFRDQGNGANRITLRGVSNLAGQDLGDGGVSTVGIYLNDVPVQGTSIAPDVALYDIQRIEVLKGPQGTLYGEGAMGGAIKMILTPPNLTEFEGKADLSLSSTQKGAANYRARGAVNFPLVRQRLALRLVGTYLDEPGFIDNVTRGEEDHDDKQVYSVRGLLSAQLTDTFSAEVLALHNVSDQDDFPQINKVLGGLRIDSPEDRYNDVDATLLGLTLRNDFGFAELTSVTSHYTLEREFVDRFVFASAVFGGNFGIPLTQDPLFFASDLETTSQELRLVSQGDQRFDWVVGAFYRDKEQDNRNDLLIGTDELDIVNAGLAALSLPAFGSNVYFRSGSVQSYEQYALYGEGNLELSDRVALTLGLRWFDEELKSDNFTTGFGIFTAFTADAPPQALSDDGFIPKLALSYELTEDHNLYVQAAKGFRSGAVNLNQPLGVGDEGATSDGLWSYEAGSKNSFANGRGIFNLSAFFSDWSHVQVNASEIPPGGASALGFIENAGDAEIYGAEAEFAAAVTERFALGAMVGYTHSELTTTRPEVNGLVGAELPNTPEWTASSYGEYRFAVALGSVFARLDVQFTDEQATRLITADPTTGAVTDDGAFVDSYIIGHFRLGLESDDGWSAALFVDNLWNEEAELGRGFQTAGPLNGTDRVTVNRPRTYGVTLSTRF